MTRKLVLLLLALLLTADFAAARSLTVLGASGVGTVNFANAKSVTVASNTKLVSRTQGTGSSRQKMTFSFWFRPSAVATDTALVTYTSGTADSIYAFVAAAASPEVLFNGGTDGFFVTTGVTFANSTWYNVVVQIDTTQGTAANRVRVFVDGVDRTSIVTNATLNYSTQWGNNTIVENAIQQSAGSVLIDEIAKIDNAITDYSIFNRGGKPADLTGQTFGNQGYWLRFETGVAATIGNDSSPNALNFANTNFVVGDFSATVP